MNSFEIWAAYQVAGSQGKVESPFTRKVGGRKKDICLCSGREEIYLELNRKICKSRRVPEISKPEKLKPLF